MSFDGLAPHYRTLERILAGRRLQSCRTAYLQELLITESVLLLGEGHGRFLGELARHGYEGEITVVDASGGMLREARRSLEGAGRTRVEFIEADVFQLELERKFGAVVTHFFLDCFKADQLEELVPKISSWIRPGGSWQVADFQVPGQWLLACRARLVLGLAYRFFRIFTKLPARQLSAPQPLLVGSGFTREQRREFNFGLLYSELWKMMSAEVEDSFPAGHTSTFAH